MTKPQGHFHTGPVRLFPMLAALILAGACGAREHYGETGGDGVEARRESAREAARANLDGSSYQDMHGALNCTDDCSGHDAGYQWAQDNAISDASECGGDSMSFIEGCEAYANDLSDETEDNADRYGSDDAAQNDHWD